MSSFLSIKLKQIKYSGQNVGRNLKFYFKIGDQSTEIKCRLVQGTVKSLDRTIFQQAIKNPASLPVSIKIIETNPVFNDLGSGSTKLQLNGPRAKSHSFSIDVKGLGRDKNKTARFTFVLEATIEPTIRYISDADSNGWLRAVFDNGRIYSLPYLLKVGILKIEKNREHFKVLEGKLIGQEGSVKLKPDGRSYLLLERKQGRPARLILDQDAKKLTVMGLGSYNIDMDYQNPLSSLTYDLEIPDEPHFGGRDYEKASKYAKTWFRVGHSGARYLHVGRRSEGCVTVTDRSKWTEIYNFLIRSRKDNYNVGELTVK